MITITYEELLQEKKAFEAEQNDENSLNFHYSDYTKGWVIYDDALINSKWQDWLAEKTGMKKSEWVATNTGWQIVATE